MNENKNNVNAAEDEIDLLELGMMLLSKWWIIFIVSMVGAAISLGITVFLMTPQYTSQQMLYVLNKTTTISMADFQIGNAITKDFIVIAKSKPVIDTAIDSIKAEYGVELTRKQILNMISVTNETDTRILTIKATYQDPVVACVVANAVAEATAQHMAQIMKSDPPTTVERAEVSTTPVSPNLKKNILIGFLAGFVLMCAIFVIQYLLNDNIRTEDDVEKYLGVSTFAVVPLIKGKNSKAGQKERKASKKEK